MGNANASRHSVRWRGYYAGRNLLAQLNRAGIVRVPDCGATGPAQPAGPRPTTYIMALFFRKYFLLCVVLVVTCSDLASQPRPRTVPTNARYTEGSGWTRWRQLPQRDLFESWSLSGQRETVSVALWSRLEFGYYQSSASFTWSCDGTLQQCFGETCEWSYGFGWRFALGENLSVLPTATAECVRLTGASQNPPTCTAGEPGCSDSCGRQALIVPPGTYAVRVRTALYDSPQAQESPLVHLPVGSSVLLLQSMPTIEVRYPSVAPWVRVRAANRVGFVFAGDLDLPIRPPPIEDIIKAADFEFRGQTQCVVDGVPQIGTTGGGR